MMASSVGSCLVSEIACKNCRFFRGDAAVMGSCRRYPQTVNKYPADWCGEFELMATLALPVVEMRDEQPRKPGRKPRDPAAA
jgi:hypothetical protein